MTFPNFFRRFPTAKTLQNCTEFLLEEKCTTNPLEFYTTENLFLNRLKLNKFLIKIITLGCFILNDMQTPPPSKVAKFSFCPKDAHCFETYAKIIFQFFFHFFRRTKYFISSFCYKKIFRKKRGLKRIKRKKIVEIKILKKKFSENIQFCFFSHNALGRL